MQEVLDSAGKEEEEEGLGEGESKEEDEKDAKTITIKETKKDDAGKAKAIEEKTIVVNEKIVKEQVTKALNYALGITNK